MHKGLFESILEWAKHRHQSRYDRDYELHIAWENELA